MDAMNASNISALADMLKQEELAPAGNQTVTPASLGVSVPAGKAAAATTQQQKPKQAPANGDIWDVEEVPEKIDVAFEKDSRKRPWYDILYKQSVSAMDAFGSGLTGNTPSSISCNQIVVKIKFPGHTMKDLVRYIVFSIVVLSALLVSCPTNRSLTRRRHFLLCRI